MTVQQTGTLIVQGLEQGARDALFTLHVVAGAAVSVLIIGGLFAVYLICRAEAKRAKRERARKRVRTYLEIDGQPVEFEVTNLREAA